MKSVVWHDTGDIRLDSVPEPEIREEIVSTAIESGLNTDQNRIDEASRLPTHNDLAHMRSQVIELARKILKKTISPPKETRRLMDKYNRLCEQTNGQTIPMSKS
jgi:hypothetical protein